MIVKHPMYLITTVKDQRYHALLWQLFSSLENVLQFMQRDKTSSIYSLRFISHWWYWNYTLAILWSPSWEGDCLVVSAHGHGKHVGKLQCQKIIMVVHPSTIPSHDHQLSSVDSKTVKIKVKKNLKPTQRKT